MSASSFALTKNIARTAVLAGVLLGAAHCGSASPSSAPPGDTVDPDGGAAPPTTTTPGQPIPLPSREEMRSLDLLNGKTAELDGQGLSAADEANAIVAYATTLPAVTSAEVQPGAGAVLVTLADGRFLSIDLAWSHLDPAAAPPPPAYDPDFAPSPPNAETHLPTAKTAMLMVQEGLPGGGGALAAKLKGWLTDAGWSATIRKPTIGALMAIGAPGFLYVTTHGDVGKSVASLDTASPVTDAEGTPIEATVGSPAKPDPDAWDKDSSSNQLFSSLMTASPQELIYSTEASYRADGKIVRRLVYAITQNFVRAHMPVAEHGLVYLDACRGGETNLLSDAFIANHAQRVIGWSTFTPIPDAWNVSARFLDRMLGANAVEPPAIRQRPFGLDATFNGLKSNGKTTAHGDTGEGNDSAELRTFGTGELLLRPSIARISTNPVGDSMKIYGDFGTDKGTVSVGGQTVPCSIWPANDGDPIDICQVPSDKWGDVQVEIGGVKSNTRELSHFVQTLHYTQSGPGTWLTDIKVHLDFRGDVLTARDQPEKDPNKTNDWTGFFADEKKTTCEVALSGAYEGCTWSGGGTFNYSTMSPNAACSAFFKFDGSNTAAPLSIQTVVSIIGAGSVQCPTGPPEALPATLQALPGLVDAAPDTFFMGVDLRTGVLAERPSAPIHEDVVSFDMVWQAAAPEAAPSDLDPR